MRAAFIIIGVLILGPNPAPAQYLHDAQSQWQIRASEHFELQSFYPDRDSAVLPIAERLLQEDSRAVGWNVSFRVRLQVYATLDQYRDLTGEPGWVAASTLGRTIRLQPIAVLKRKSILESTLRHEIFHVLIDSRARPDTPLWLHEGLVLFLSSPESSSVPHDSMTAAQIDAALRSARNRAESERAYAAARGRVARLVAHYGKEAVLSWLTQGVPADEAGGSGSDDHPRR